MPAPAIFADPDLTTLLAPIRTQSSFIGVFGSEPQVCVRDAPGLPQECHVYPQLMLSPELGWVGSWQAGEKRTGRGWL